MQLFKYYVSKFSGYINNVVSYFQDLYKLITLRDKFILTELTDRAFQSPNGLYQFDVSLLGIRFTSIVIAVGSKYVAAAADYGNESLIRPEKHDPLARQDFHKIEKLIGIESIASRTDIAIEAYRVGLKKSLNTDNISHFIGSLLDENFKNWDSQTSLNDQVRYFVMQIIAKVIFDVHELPKEVISLISQAENALINYEQTTQKEFDRIKNEIKDLSDNLVKEHYNRIATNKPYAAQYINSVELEKLIAVNPVGSLVVEGNLSTLLTAAILTLSQNKEIFKKIKAEAEQLDLSDPQKIDLNKLKSLPYLDSFYLECLRFFSPNPPIVRYVSKSAKLADLNLPPRTRLFVPVRAIMHHPSLWESPQQFNPERKGNNQDLIPGVFPFIPFSTGKRTCPASLSFVQVVLKTAAVLLTKHYDCEINMPYETIPIDTKQPRFKKTYFMSLKPAISSSSPEIIFSNSNANMMNSNCVNLNSIEFANQKKDKRSHSHRL